MSRLGINDARNVIHFAPNFLNFAPKLFVKRFSAKGLNKSAVRKFKGFKVFSGGENEQQRTAEFR